MRAAAKSACGEFREPALDEVQPARAGRGEVQVKAGVGSEPAFDRGGLVGGVVVEHEVHLQLGGDLAVDRLQQALELDRAMAVVQRSDYLSRGGVQGSEQAEGTVALVVVRSALGHARQHRQNRRGPIQRLI
jgi:hypothetical protein